MFSIVDAKATGKVAILTCSTLWEYVSFIKDVERFGDIEHTRNILKCSANFEKTPNKHEEHVHTYLTQTPDTHAVVFMSIAGRRYKPTGIHDVRHPRMDLFDTTDYISFVFNIHESGTTYIRNDEKVSGRGKLNVKS